VQSSMKPTPKPSKPKRKSRLCPCCGQPVKGTPAALCLDCQADARTTVELDLDDEIEE